MQHTDGSFLSVDGYFTVVLSHHRDKNRDGEVETWYLVPSLSRDWGSIWYNRVTVAHPLSMSCSLKRPTMPRLPLRIG